MFSLFLLLLAGSSLAVLAQESCQNPPFWLFFRREDVRTIYPQLPIESVFIVVSDGVVDDAFATAVRGELIYISSNVAEFPINWCIRSDEYETLDYSLSMISLDPDVLEHPNTSIPDKGTIDNRPYRYRIRLRCVGSSTSNSIVRVTVNLTNPVAAVTYCSVVLYFARDCRGVESDEVPTGLANQGITDGYLDINTTFKDPPPTKIGLPVRSNRLTVILTSVLVPLFVITLIILGIVLSVFLVWYRRKSKVYETFQLEQVSTAYRQAHDPWTKRGPHEKEFPPESLKLTRELGEGAFGIVYQAEAKGIVGAEDEWSNVAVKQLRQGSNDADDFLREVDFMSKLDHPNVVRLLGVCTLEEPFSMLFEYMDLGDLCAFLREAVGLGKVDGEEEKENKDEESDDFLNEPLLTKEELLMIVKQVSEGMAYISSLHLVHRDLATRNCLVATGLVVKIGDFGMSRNVNESDYYRVHGSAMLPVRWMSPESILYGKFTTETDIWSFGILLWEVFTFGQQPYFGLQNEEVIQFIQKGGHPEPPEDCLAEKLMLQCWERNPKKRPDFVSITDAIQELMDHYQQEEQES